MRKIENYIKAVSRLQEAVTEYSENATNTLLRDGLIQRFEFTFELSWKSLKAYMQDQGISEEINFPKDVLRTAYENHLIQNEEVWLKMLSARNATSHIYDDRVAESIGKDICQSFLMPLTELAKYYSKN